MLAVGPIESAFRYSPGVRRVGFLGAGQSYMEGAPGGGNAILSTPQPYSCERGVNGTSPHGPQTPGVVPLVPPVSEDILSPAVNQFAFMNTWARDAVAHHRAIGGSFMSQQDPTSGSYANQLGQIDDVVTALAPTGIDYIALWVQNGFTDETGNAARVDSTPNIPWATYLRQLRATLEGYRGELVTRTGQTFRPPVFITVLSFWQQGATAIDAGYSLEQLITGVSDGDVFIEGTTQPFALGADQVHLTPEGYRAYGTRSGCVMHVVLSQGLRWRPLYPRRATANGSRVTLEYFVPAIAFGWHTRGANALELDTDASPTWRGPAGPSSTHGFAYRELVGPARAVTAVSMGPVVGEIASVHVDLDGAAELGGTLDYCFNGAAPPNHAIGNLRDNFNMPTVTGDPSWQFAVPSRTVIT